MPVQRTFLRSALIGEMRECDALPSASASANSPAGSLRFGVTRVTHAHELGVIGPRLQDQHRLHPGC
ncbi:hypothetical protein D3C87_1219020 [compost metagenome]